MPCSFSSNSINCNLAPKGNEFWKARTRHGRHAIFADVELLRQACNEYFQWSKDNPLYETKVGFSNGCAVSQEVPKMRAMTLSGLSIFLGITSKTLAQWKHERDDLRPAIEEAEEVIRQSKFEGAAAGLLNANIISRDLGLKDHQTIDHNVPAMLVEAPDKDVEQPPVHGE
jgi:hypothetical protein